MVIIIYATLDAFINSANQTRANLIKDQFLCVCLLKVTSNFIIYERIYCALDL